MFLDELASLEKLPSLEDAATKGRKAGLRIVAGLQSTAQLEKIYGREEASA
jgi:type IV secretory pathway TraG/TraD family ATPase VirD4